MDIDELWQATLRDAHIEAFDARLIKLPGERAPNGVSAMTWVRDDTIFPEDLGGPVGDANDEEIRDLRRVAIWINRIPEGNAGLLRHELEHTHQYEDHGKGLQQLHACAEDILIRHAGGVPKSGSLYNLIPMEADANAAASAFVRSIFGDERIDSLLAARDEHSGLFRAGEPPKPVATLKTRMEDFVAHAERIATDFARTARSDD